MNLPIVNPNSAKATFFSASTSLPSLDASCSPEKVFFAAPINLSRGDLISAVRLSSLLGDIGNTNT